MSHETWLKKVSPFRIRIVQHLWYRTQGVLWEVWDKIQEREITRKVISPRKLASTSPMWPNLQKTYAAITKVWISCIFCWLQRMNSIHFSLVILSHMAHWDFARIQTLFFITNYTSFEPFAFLLTKFF